MSGHADRHRHEAGPNVDLWGAAVSHGVDEAGQFHVTRTEMEAHMSDRFVDLGR